ncbi:MAG: IclR family transcriptional regulator C-terminal domain-containing protein [Umezawaea sp.]
MSLPDRSTDFVRSLERGLSVIRAFDADHARLTLSDVARATGLTRAAARRFLHTLVELGYVGTDGRLFSLRPKVLELGYAYLSGLALPEIALPHLEDLVATVHESSSVSVLDGADVVYVARVPTRRIMTVSISVGTRFPAYATAMGRVLLADRSGEWLEDYLASVRLHPLTRNTIIDPDVLREELRVVREQGWSLVDEELEEGLRSLAVPVRRPDGSVLAAVNLSAHAGRGSAASIREELLPHLVSTAAAVERDLRR